MDTFDAGSFSDVAKSDLGKGAWEFLNTQDSLIRLETATYLKRPALEGLQEQLLDRFGDAIRGDRMKQMMGRMVRQIMESNGYQLDRTGVPIRVGNLFTSAARYKRA